MEPALQGKSPFCSSNAGLWQRHMKKAGRPLWNASPVSAELLTGSCRNPRECFRVDEVEIWGGGCKISMLKVKSKIISFISFNHLQNRRHRGYVLSEARGGKHRVSQEVSPETGFTPPEPLTHQLKPEFCTQELQRLSSQTATSGLETSVYLPRCPSGVLLVTTGLRPSTAQLQHSLTLSSALELLRAPIHKKLH